VTAAQLSSALARYGKVSSYQVTAILPPLLMASLFPSGDLKYANRVRWSAGADIRQHTVVG